MPTMIKPRTLGVLTKAERRGAGASYVVTGLGLFDLAHAEADRFESDQALWILAAKALPKGAVLDTAMPKPCAELLVAGSAVTPGGEPRPAMLVEWLVGPLHKRVAVMGDRLWQIGGGGYVQTEPKPFTEMPLHPERAFGGAGFPDNPAGVGFKSANRIQAREPAPLPNLERAERMIRTIEDVPPPALCGPIDLASPLRRRFAGTYDAHWIKSRAPELPDDVDPRLFLLAPSDQQFEGFLQGGEPFALRGFCKDRPEIRGTLPRFRVRAFLARKAEAGGEGELAEIAMRIDTLWLFAGARRGVLVYRGALPVSDIDAADISHVMLAYERSEDEPRPFAHYVDVWRMRSDREQAFKHAFSESQLAPALPAETVARRAAERLALQADRLARHAAGQRWMIERQLRRSGLPEALWPAMPEPEPDPGLAAVPMPTPEELEEGEVDLAAMLDAIEALRVKTEQKTEEARALAAPMLEAVAALKSPDAEAGAVDALLAALDRLGVENPAHQIDAALGGLTLPDLPVEVDPTVAAEAAGKLDAAKNWRGAMLDAARGLVLDEEGEFAAAQGRFLDLPESRPLAAARVAMAEARTPAPILPATDRPAEARERTPASTGTLDIAELLGALDRETRVPKEQVGEIRDKLAVAEAGIRDALPNLPAEGSAIEALLAAVSPDGGAGASNSSDPNAAVATAIATRDRALDDAAAMLDAQEEQIVSGLKQMRRMAPTATAPHRPLLRTVARRFGDAIIAAARSGLSLRGRDMAGADLRGADLSGVDLEGALLEQADLAGADLRGARLVDAALTAAVLDQADLSDADLSRANLAKCRARGASFSRAVFEESLLLETDLSGARFEGASLTGIRFIQATANEAHFGGARLDGCMVIKSGFDRSVWDGAVLGRTQFVELSMRASTWRGAALTRCAFLKLSAPDADFTGAALSHCVFAGEADLNRAVFEEATGENAGFMQAMLARARFDRARFENCNFGRADLSGASFRLASLKTSLFGSADLFGADLLGANLFKAQLRRADCSGARLRGANLYAAVLNDADLTGADLTGANLGKTLLEVDTNVG